MYPYLGNIFSSFGIGSKGSKSFIQQNGLVLLSEAERRDVVKI